MRVARVLAWHVDEGRGLTAESFQPGLDVIELAIVEPRSDTAEVMQAVVGGQSHQQRSDSAAAPPLALPPAADHHLLHPMQFDLEPGVRTPSGLIDRIAALGNDALQPKLISSLPCGLKIAVEDRWDLDP